MEVDGGVRGVLAGDCGPDAAADLDGRGGHGVNLVALGWKTVRDLGAAAPDTVLNMVGWFGAFALIWLVGLTALWRREAEAGQRELQRQRERSELARDLHDMVGHNVASIVMRAERAMLRGGADDDDLDFIVERGNDAIGEARSLIGTLRGDGASPRTGEDSRVATTASALLDEPPGTPRRRRVHRSGDDSGCRTSLAAVGALHRVCRPARGGQQRRPPW